MSRSQSITHINAETVVKGRLRNGHHVEVRGYVDGEIETETLVVHDTGRVYGRVRAGTAEVFGVLQGEVIVRELINIRSSGSVVGNVQYGKLAMEQGGDLTAEVRNVPPSIGGDLDLTVDRGRSVRVTTRDLTAVDPDNLAHDLTYRVTNLRNGQVMLFGATTKPVDSFTQADIEMGSVLFAHDGSGSGSGSFDVVVSDVSGGHSGAPQTVTVNVRG